MNFSQVEAEIYRSGAPTEQNLSFLKTLGLKTIVCLSNDCVDEILLSFTEERSINILNIGDSMQDNFGESSTVSEGVVTGALNVIISQVNLPALVMCKSGRNQTGCVVGCLRKLQKWSMISIFEEYRRFAGTKMQQQYEQFIELFDTDLVTLSNVNTPSFLNFEGK